MPAGLQRLYGHDHLHFITFSCYQRLPLLKSARARGVFVRELAQLRERLGFRLIGYVVMPEHVHLLLSEPTRATLADALHFLKLSFAKRLHSQRPEKSGSFWQKRYYDRNVRDYREFVVKLRYLHRNPVKRGLVASPEDWKWSSYRHYLLREVGQVEIESEWTARDRERKAVGGPERMFLHPG